MGVTIKDGKGSGREAEVNSSYALVAAATVSEEAHAAALAGLAFTWANATYDYDAADTILLVRNESRDYDLVITDIWYWSDTETEVDVQCPTATFTIAGTAVTGVNTNRKSSIVAPVTAKCDETGNVKGVIVYALRAAADREYHYDTRGMLILGNDQAVGVDYVTAGAEAHVTIAGYFKKI